MVNFKQILTEDNTEPNTEFLKQLRSKLPEFFTKDKYGIDKNGKEVVVEAGGFDIQKFQESLSKHNVNEITDGYTLNFVGKKYAELKTGKPTTTVVIPDVQHNTQQKNSHSENVFLTGDNLDVLKHLQKAYTNSIDMIYLDPPYNTGSDGFVYNDKFDLSDEELRNTFSMNEDEIKKLHLLNGRSSHSAWLTFMYPRLKLARQLLKDTGVIFMSIDDNEQANLKILLDNVFGESQFVGNIAWESKTKSQNTADAFDKLQPRVEHIFVYEKKNHRHFNLNILEQKQYDLVDENGPYREKRVEQMSSEGQRGRHTMIFPIENIFPPEGKQWKWGKETIDKYKDRGDLLLKEGIPYIKMRPTDERSDKTAPFWAFIKDFVDETPILHKEYGTAESAKSELKEKYFNGQSVFDTVKPVSLIKKLLFHGTDKESIILDFFAGSATTADAVMQLNAEDGGNRKWILNTLDEKTKDSSVAYKAGYLTIDEIARERIKRSGEKIKKEHPDLGVHFDSGFKHYYVKEMDANTIDKIIDFDPNSIQILTEDVVSEFAGNAVKLGEYYEKSDKDKVNPKFANVVDTGATGEDTILQTWLINDGYKLDVPVKTLELVHHNVHYVEDGAMAYIIDQFTQEDVEALLNLIGTRQLNVKTIIVFGYSFDFATMTSLKNNVKTALDGVRVEVRY